MGPSVMEPVPSEPLAEPVTRADLPGSFADWKANAEKVLGREVSTFDFFNQVFRDELEAAERALTEGRDDG